MRVHELTLETGDVTWQSIFWGETLGLPVRESANGAIEVSLQASTIRFEQARMAADPRYHFAINIPRGSIRAAAAWVEERHYLLAFHGDPDEEEARRSPIPIAAPRRSTSSIRPATSWS